MGDVFIASMRWHPLADSFTATHSGAAPTAKLFEPHLIEQVAYFNGSQTRGQRQKTWDFVRLISRDVMMIDFQRTA